MPVKSAFAFLAAALLGSEVSGASRNLGRRAMAQYGEPVILPPLVVPAIAAGAFAAGALAVGALAIGALAIGRMEIREARIRKLRIDELSLRNGETIESAKGEGTDAA